VTGSILRAGLAHANSFVHDADGTLEISIKTALRARVPVKGYWGHKPRGGIEGRARATCTVELVDKMYRPAHRNAQQPITLSLILDLGAAICTPKLGQHLSSETTMRILILLSLILSTLAAQAQSSSNLANACNFDALPTTREVRSREFGPSVDYGKLAVRCAEAGYTECKISREGYLDRPFWLYPRWHVWVVGYRTVPLTNREIKTQLCTQAAVCKQRALIATDEMASQYLALVDQIDAGYNCRL